MTTLFALYAAVFADGDWFTDRAAAVGLSFVHENGMQGHFYIAETMGSGCALFDYDRDGDLDVYLVQGHTLFGSADSGSTLGDQLFRNDSKRHSNGRLELRFTNVTQAAGIRANGYGMGVTVGDYDGDGWLDIYVSNYGQNQLWHNLANGRFENITGKAGCNDAGWSVAAAFFDYDRDGHQDLFVSNYIQFDASNHRVCPNSAGINDYCGPSLYPDAPDRLFRNQGDGRFKDVTSAAGINAFGSALGLLIGDFNDDFFPDIYVANDADPNLLWINQGNGTFVDDALFSGCAVNSQGAPEASMGTDLEDFDGDGDLDIFLTHLSGETHTLYVNRGKGLFEDQTHRYGLGSTTRSATGFGTGWFDYDNDGRLDLFIANGAVYAIESLRRAGDPYPLHQPNQLFRQLENAKYEDVSRLAGSVFSLSEVSRGAAFGDIDNDGDTDILVTNNHGPVRLMINEMGNRANWIGFSVTEGTHSMPAIGAVVGLERPAKPVHWHRVHVDASYASSQDPRVIIGLGDKTSAGRVLVRFADGSIEHWSDLTINQYHELKRGTGSRGGP